VVLEKETSKSLDILEWKQAVTETVISKRADEASVQMPFLVVTKSRSSAEKSKIGHPFKAGHPPFLGAVVLKINFIGLGTDGYNKPGAV
jgi:hypothetical protein